jgi:type I restriction enzyme M protein
LSNKGRAAIVVPTGFITAQSGIEKKIREKMVEEKMLRGVVTMPSNIFATTGTNVSILFIDKANTKGDIVLMDASKLGTTVKDGKNQKTLLSAAEEQTIINTFNNHEAVEDFSVVVSYNEIMAKNCSFSAGQYFDVKIEYTDITATEFEAKMNGYKQTLNELFAESRNLEKEIKQQSEGLSYA